MKMYKAIKNGHSVLGILEVDIPKYAAHGYDVYASEVTGVFRESEAEWVLHQAATKQHEGLLEDLDPSDSKKSVIWNLTDAELAAQKKQDTYGREYGGMTYGSYILVGIIALFTIVILYVVMKGN